MVLGRGACAVVGVVVLLLRGAVQAAADVC